MTVKTRELNERLLDQSRIALKAAGDKDIEIAGGASEEIRIVYESDDFSVSTSGSNSRLGIRTLQDQRLGFVSTKSTSDAALIEAVGEAYSMARLSPPSEHYSLAEPGPQHSPGKEFIHENGDLLALPESQIIDYTEEVIREAMQDPRIRLDRVELALTRDAKTLVNSKGIELSMRRSYLSWSAMGMARQDDQVTSFDYDGAVAFNTDQIAPRIAASMGRFRDSVISSLNPRSGKSYKGPVLIHPALVRQFILGTISSNANGKNQQDGTSPWKESLNQKVASESLTVFEDPLDTERLETYLPFDREGFFTGKHNIVENGVLKFVGHNIYSASRAGARPTGNASGGSGSTPAVGFFNVKLELNDSLDKKDLTELKKSLGSGLLIKRFSGNADPSSGHFSGVAKNSYWIENGEMFPVKEMMISGNLFELLNSIVAASSGDFEIMGGARAPYLIVDGISVTSGSAV